MLYEMNVQYMNMIRPWHHVANCTRQILSDPSNPFANSSYARIVSASLELFERLTTNYVEPAWKLDSTIINGEKIPIVNQVVYQKPFCNLLHFRRVKDKLTQPKVLLVAPLSGHFATLLRGTVREFLPDHETYITNWRNVREVPVSEGSFSFDDYVEYLMEFLAYLGPDTHVVAVCQPL